MSSHEQLLVRHSLQQTSIAPVRIAAIAPGHSFHDFGKAAFGTLELTFAESPPHPRTLTIHLGEKLAEPLRLDREPGGSVRYRAIPLDVRPGECRYRVIIPPDQRNTGPHAIPMPAEIGEVLPFRYAEIEGLPGDAPLPSCRQLAVHYPFDDAAAHFHCDNTVLNEVWELCRYTIKATSFCGLYVDGDRERIPYEADAYLNQLSHYCVDRQYGMARATLEHFVEHPTWPTEWQFQFILMAWTEYLCSGCDDFLRRHYETLKTRLLLPLARADGLISTQNGALTPQLLQALHLEQLRDIVDWPPADFAGNGVPGERDGYDMRPVNTAVNAFYYQALRVMTRIARHLGHEDDRQRFRIEAQKVQWAVSSTLLDLDHGIYVDGEDSRHHSLHGNMLPLAFGLIPDSLVPGVLRFLRTRGMACSVYGAQFLLDALFAAGDDEHAFSLLTDTGERGWAHMLHDLGSTMTLEAWDPRFKPNLDWNHAWGAAPANLIPRWILGVQPLQPGFQRVRVQPHPGPLNELRGRVPLPQGPLDIQMERSPSGWSLTVDLPDGVHGDIYLPGATKPHRLPPGHHHFP